MSSASIREAFKKFVEWYRWTLQISLISCDHLSLQYCTTLLGCISLLCRCAYCYRWRNSVVPVGLSVDLSKSWAVKKTAEPIEMLFELKERDQQFSTTESELWRNVRPSAFQLQETRLKSDNMMDVPILWLTVSVYELFERPSLVLYYGTFINLYDVIHDMIRI